MTSMDFLNKVHKILDSQEYNLSYSPAKSKNYMQEMTWKRKRLLSLMAAMDNYSDYLLLWSPRDKKLWYLDIEHEEFHPLAKWEEFIADPGKYLNGMIEGEFEE